MHYTKLSWGWGSEEKGEIERTRESLCACVHVCLCVCMRGCVFMSKLRMAPHTDALETVTN